MTLGKVHIVVSGVACGSNLGFCGFNKGQRSVTVNSRVNEMAKAGVEEKGKARVNSRQSWIFFFPLITVPTY